MRKLLLGSTAVAAAALLAPQDAAAQGADPFLPGGPPMVSHRALEVRVGGFFRFNYNFTDENNGFANTNNRNGALAPGVAATNATGGLAAPQSTNTGKSDFASDTEIHVVANGKAANGLRYGGAIELQVDQNDGTFSDTSRTSTNKTMVNTDEMWMFIAGDFGQIRVGDEDGVLGGLMFSGHVTNFGSGGLDGDWFDSVTPRSRNSTLFPGDVGDNTKITYLSPQFFGFDVGASFAFNTGEGEDTGCVLNYQTAQCDRANAFSGAPRRHNELQIAGRWRGSFAGVGLSVTGGAILAEPTKVIASGAPGSAAGASAQHFNLYNGGLQATAYGFLVGGHVFWGDANFGSPLLRTGPVGNVVDGTNFRQYFVGASYTLGAFTVGANYYNARSAGVQTIAAKRVEDGYNIGATYRLAPGLEVIAEFTDVTRKEVGYDFFSESAVPTIGGRPVNVGRKADTQVVIVGTRIAF